MSPLHRIVCATSGLLCLASIVLFNLYPDLMLPLEMRLTFGGVWIIMALAAAYWLFKPAPINPGVVVAETVLSDTRGNGGSVVVVSSEKGPEPYKPYVWSWNRTPLERLTKRLLDLPHDYIDEPTCYGDHVQAEMRKAYDAAKLKGWFASWRERRERRKWGRDSTMWAAQLVAYRLLGIPPREEREAFQQLLKDKERLDYLETMMMDRMVSVTGKCCTRHASPTGEAHVHLNGIGYMPFADSIRGAIDNSMEYSKNPVEQKPLELQPL